MTGMMMVFGLTPNI